MSSANETPNIAGSTSPETNASAPPDPEISAAAGSEVPHSEGSKRGPALPAKKELAPLLLGVGLLYLVVAKATSTWKADGGGLLGFLSAFLWSYGAILLLFAIVALVVSFFWGSVHAAVKVWGAYAVALVLGPLALWYWVGAYNWLRDLIIATLVLIVVWRFRTQTTSGIVRLLERYELWLRRRGADAANAYAGVLAASGWLRAALGSTAWCRCYGVLAWVVLTWAIASVGNVVFGPHWLTPSKPLKADPVRFAELAKHIKRPTAREPAAADAPLRLGVTLSGGGFRAALMHAGVLAALEDLGTPIAGLATVSGGSIVGGFYVAGGDPVAFKEAVAEGRFNLRRELFDAQNLLLLPCPGRIPVLDIDLLWFCSHSRIGAQADLLDRVLLDGTRVSDLPSGNGRRAWWTMPPFWVIGATDLLRGEAIGISAHGVFRRAHATPARGLHRDQLRREPSSALFHDRSSWPGLDQRRVSELIAVSGAFPGAFGSTDFQLEDGKRFQIVDGGVTDNLGYSLLASALEESTWRAEALDADGRQLKDETGLNANGRQWHLDMIIISDGGMPLLEEKTMPTHLELIRAMDVVYASAGIAVAGNSVRKLWLSPVTIREPELGDEDLQRLPEHFRMRWNLKTLGHLQEDFRHAKRTFLRTSTLKDSFDLPPHERVKRYFTGGPSPEGSETVDALFRLGQYLVYLNSCDLQAGLQLARVHCEAPAITAAVSPR